MELEDTEQKLPDVQEPIVSFKSLSERKLYVIRNPEINENLIEISGYDLDIVFNLKYLNTMADIDDACNGIAMLFKQLITNQLLEYKSDKQNK